MLYCQQFPYLIYRHQANLKIALVFPIFVTPPTTKKKNGRKRRITQVKPSLEIRHILKQNFIINFNGERKKETAIEPHSPIYLQYYFQYKPSGVHFLFKVATVSALSVYFFNEFWCRTIMVSKQFLVQTFIFLICLSYTICYAIESSSLESQVPCRNVCRPSPKCPTHCQLISCESRQSMMYSCVATIRNLAIDNDISIYPTASPSLQATSAYAHVAGDPHIRTFDGRDFDCMGRGEYLLASSVYAPWFRLHGRFRGKGIGTATTGLAFRHQSAFVEFSISTSTRNDYIMVGECPVVVWVTHNKKGSTPIRPLQFSRSIYNGVEIEYGSQRLVAFFKDGLRLFVETVYVESFGCYFSLSQLLVPGTIQSKGWIRGLFGSADGKLWNDLRRRNGRIFRSDVYPTLSTSRGTRYCSQWCIMRPYFSTFNDASKFDYSVCGRSNFFGDDLENESDFVKSNKIDVTKRQMETKLIEDEIEEVCRDNLACRFDATVSGLKAARAYMRALFISEAIGRDPASLSPMISNAPLVRISYYDHKNEEEETLDGNSKTMEFEYFRA